MQNTICCLIFIFFVVDQSLATTTPFHTVKEDKQEIENQMVTTPPSGILEKSQKSRNGFFKKWINKILLKRIAKKLKANREYNQYTKIATLGLGLGVLSFLGFWFMVLSLSWSGTVAIICGLAALAADILTIRVLTKTRNNKSEFLSERTKATIGLIFALLTGVIPLLALIIVLLSL